MDHCTAAAHCPNSFLVSTTTCSAAQMALLLAAPAQALLAAASLQLLGGAACCIARCTTAAVCQHVEALVCSTSAVMHHWPECGGCCCESDEDESPYEELPTKRPRRSKKPLAKSSKGKVQVKPKSNVREDWRSAVTSSQIHSDDSERTKRLKEFRAAEKYQLAVEDVL